MIPKHIQLIAEEILDAVLWTDRFNIADTVKIARAIEELLEKEGYEIVMTVSQSA